MTKLKSIQEQLDALSNQIANLNKTDKYYSVLEISNEIGVTTTMMYRDIRSKNIPIPSHVVKINKKYTQAEYEIVKKFYANRSNTSVGKVTQQRKEAGFYSIGDLAAAAGLARFVVQYHIKNKHIPAPSRTYERLCGFYYNKNEIKKCLEYLNNNKGKLRKERELINII